MSSRGHRSPRIVVIGSINMDLVVRCASIARPGETISGQSLREIPGGKGANQAVAAARLGAQVTMVGRVGEDAFGKTLRDGLLREGIEVSHVQITAGVSSGVAVIQVDDAGQNSIVVIPGANGLVTAEDVLAAASVIREADAVLLQFEIPLQTVKAAVDLARRSGVRVIVDPAPARADAAASVLSADWLCPNETEAESLTGLVVETEFQACAAAKSLRQRGCGRSLITLGSRGIVLCGEGGVLQRADAFRIAVVDTTAAGDAFAAGLGVSLSRGAADAEAVRFACAAGAIAATKSGAQPAMPYLQEVESLLRDQPEAAVLQPV
ncbi:MAG: ribokinase [Planctomycetia bacterium]